MHATSAKTPFHLWIIGILSLLWNAMGAFDYTATQMKLDFYMSQFTPEQLEYIYSSPAWMDGAWAIAVWGSLVGSLGLLFRQAWSTLLFGLAILGIAVTSVYSYMLTDATAVMGEGSYKIMVAVWVIALALYFYARAMTTRRVLS